MSISCVFSMPDVVFFSQSCVTLFASLTIVIYVVMNYYYYCLPCTKSSLGYLVGQMTAEGSPST